MNEQRRSTGFEFIIRRLDEDEAEARKATPGPWALVDRGHSLTVRGGPHEEIAVCAFDQDQFPASSEWISDEPDVQHIARHDPARVLRDVAAKRKAVECLQQIANGCTEPGWDGIAEEALWHLASVYSNHPDYQENWAW
ncbi:MULTISPECIES: DUF6221 family protein [unclassified Rhodococcus (in: high G+C Gram-positive bacteria)]|uniref:DUF6221 family protein n=1 Tax=unclassified Rhodococcus (in: high G+C Gram-positive bacteria) TaxID=192944 RepID=UPI000B9ADD14|nr:MULTISPECIES: DUF6221 family protein [unclassified Rhodococcus (in: high G+C Gram-positive bacteria)]OZE35619.1 hypothetical protein CH259_16465 [Rhodococcus sp. 05-2254-4]OZE48048.1 hypothetical protein CH261_09060 [Rhodococcus sp. 05-2254-3]OZE49259.1 hypothetical protein CH283_16845 [Rhodococcus sp. 05-2254-2]